MRWEKQPVDEYVHDCLLWEEHTRSHIFLICAYIDVLG